MQNALVRINELQNEMIKKSKTINGADEYVQAKMELFKQSEKADEELKNIQIQEQMLTESFLASHK